MFELRRLAFLIGLSPALAPSAHAAPSFVRASKASQGPSGCSGGAFLDARLDDPSVGAQCWSCPSGYVRTLESVTSAKACAKPATSGFVEADYKHKWLCDGSKGEFFDPRKGGECWSCPKNRPRRTAYAVTSDKACATKEVFGEKLSKAEFERKVKTCTKGAFFDPRKGGECWKCPSGYTRTLEPVTGKKACAKELPESLKAATLQGHFGCKKGEFLDPRNGGECWSCPKSHPFRTVNRVDGERACTNEPLGVLAADSADFCKQFVGAIGRARTEGETAFAELERLIDPVLQPIEGPILKEVEAMSEAVGGDGSIQRALERIPADARSKAAEFGRAVGGASSALAGVLLDPRICTDSLEATEKRLMAAAKLPAWVKGQFLWFSVAGTFTHTVHKATMKVGLTFITNAGGDRGVFVTVAAGATSAPQPFSLAFSAMLFPNMVWADFGLTPVPAIGVSVSKGGTFDDLFKGYEELLPLVKVVDGIDVAWSPGAPTRLPTLGVSKTLKSVGPEGSSLLELTAMACWDLPLPDPRSLLAR